MHAFMYALNKGLKHVRVHARVHVRMAAPMHPCICERIHVYMHVCIGQVLEAGLLTSGRVSRKPNVMQPCHSICRAVQVKHHVRP